MKNLRHTCRGAPFFYLLFFIVMMTLFTLLTLLTILTLLTLLTILTILTIQPLLTLLLLFIIKFPYNARSDWLKQRALSENRARVDDGKSSNFRFGILTNLTQIKHALWLRQMQWKRAIYLQ